MKRHEMQELGARVEQLLDDFGQAGDPAAQARAESLARAVMDLYAVGLARVVDLADEGGVLRTFADDDVVGSLLLLHDLHPDDVDTRIQAALDRVRPYLGSHAGGIDYLGVDDDGVAHLTLQGSCSGCPSSSVTVTLTIETAILEAAPEVASVDVVGVVVAEPPKPLLQIGLRPGLAPALSPAQAEDLRAGDWGHLDSVPALGAMAAVQVAGTGLLVANLDGAAYAYLDGCPRCEAGLASGQLEGDILTCAFCAARYDIRLAGRALEGGSGHLSPLPMLPDGAGWRVALVGGVPV